MVGFRPMPTFTRPAERDSMLPSATSTFGARRSASANGDFPDGTCRQFATPSGLYADRLLNFPFARKGKYRGHDD